MKERNFGPVRFLPGSNNGNYPFCHSIFLEDDGVLIDPASDRERLIRLRKKSIVKMVWLTHWHEDHFMNLDLFEDLPLYISRADAPMLSDIEILLDGYGVPVDQRQVWRDILRTQFHFAPRAPAGFFQDRQTVKLNNITVEIFSTPGHTPGHMAFYFKEPGVLFTGDYDLTKFGPWYGDLKSSIKETKASVHRLKKINASIWITAHGTGIFEQNPGKLWDRYLGVIEQREKKLLEFLIVPRTMEEIVNQWIIYRKPREPIDLYTFSEQAMVTKHLEHLIEKCIINKKSNKYSLI